MKRGVKFFFKLFITVLKLSAFTFGGGYVIVTLMRSEFVEKLGWISEDEMLDFTAIAQSSPGAIAVNASILIGYRLAGVPGALLTSIATVTPPLVILSLVSVAYTAFRDNTVIANVMRGMQAGVAAVIADVVFDMASTICKRREAAEIIIMIAAFAAVTLFQINVMLVIIVCILFGALRYAGKAANVKK